VPKRQEVVNIVAPGSFGLNTEDSPTELPLEFASVANNCVIDNFGRLGARKGFSLTTTTSTPLGSAEVVSVIHHTTDSGDVGVFSSGNGKLLKGEETLTDVSGALSITGDNWELESWDNELWAAQQGHSLARFDNGGTNVFVAVSGAPAANFVFGGAGRLWAGGDSTAPTTLYWSSLLDGTQWHGGDSGSLDLKTVWPAGYDKLVTGCIFNNLLVLFGQKSILIYSGIDDPSTMAKVEDFTQIGIVSRDSKVDIGTDLVFLSEGGLRSLGRLIQADGSQPVADIAKQIRTDLFNAIDSEGERIKMIYSQNERFILVIFTGQNIAYCFDTRRPLETGDLRATRWTSLIPSCGTTKLQGGDLIFGGTGGIMGYDTSYRDQGNPYSFDYTSPSTDLGAPSVAKFLKRLNPIFISTQTDTVIVKWAYGFSANFTSQAIDFSSSTSFTPAYYGISMYNNGALYTGGTPINDPVVHTSGSGDVLSVGLSTTIDGNKFSLQEIEMHLVTGRKI